MPNVEERLQCSRRFRRHVPVSGRRRHDRQRHRPQRHHVYGRRRPHFRQSRHARRQAGRRSGPAPAAARVIYAVRLRQFGAAAAAARSSIRSSTTWATFSTASSRDDSRFPTSKASTAASPPVIWATLPCGLAGGCGGIQKPKSFSMIRSPILISAAHSGPVLRLYRTPRSLGRYRSPHTFARTTREYKRR